MRYLILLLLFVGMTTKAQVFQGMNDSILKLKKIKSIKEVNAIGVVLHSVNFDESFNVLIDDNVIYSRKSVFSYSSAGQKIREEQFEKNKFSVLKEFDYDSKGNLKKETEYLKKKNAKPYRQWEFEYDSLNEKTNERFYYEGVKSEEFHYTNFYNDNKVVKVVQYSIDSMQKWQTDIQWNGNAKNVVLERFYEDTLVERFVNEYNANGCLVSHKLYEPTDTPFLLFHFFERSYKYDKAFLKTHSWKQLSEKGDIEDVGTETFRYEKNLLVEKQSDKGALIKYVYEYWE